MIKQNKKVLVIRCGLLGDTIDATSVIKPLMELYGSSVEIYWVSKPGICELFKFDSRVKKVYSLRHTKLPFFLNIDKFRIILDSLFHPFDLILNLEISNKFNDIVKKGGTLYISACNAKSIYKIENDSLQLAYKGSLSRPNGLLFRNDSLFVMNSKSQDLKVISKDEQLTTLTKDIGAGDGITKLNKDELIVSDWNGQLFHIDQKFNKKLLLDTQKEGFNSADIQYFEDRNLLLVPTFSGNTAAAYRIKK